MIENLKNNDMKHFSFTWEIAGIKCIGADVVFSFFIIERLPNGLEMVSRITSSFYIN